MAQGIAFALPWMKPRSTVKRRRRITETQVHQMPVAASPYTPVHSHLVPGTASSWRFGSLRMAGILRILPPRWGRAGTRVEAPVCLGDLSPLALRYVDAHTCGHKAALSSSSRLLLPLDGADGPCYRHFNGFNYSNNHHGR